MEQIANVKNKLTSTHRVNSRYVWTNVDGVTTSTSSEFMYELNENKVQFVKNGDKNVNFVLCHFQRFVIYLQRECF